METSIKLSDEELTSIKSLQSKFQETIFRMGESQIERMELDRLVANFIEKEKSLKENWMTLQSQEKDLIDNIIKKYGEGQLNMADGTFIPANLK